MKVDETYSNEKNESRSKYLLKNVGILTISNFASKILVFLLVPLYTSVLSTDEVGIYDLVVSTISLLFPILSLNIVDALLRFMMDKDQNIEEVASIAAKYILFSMVPVFVFLLIAGKVSSLQWIHDYELLIFIYYLSTCANQYLIQFAKGRDLIKDMGIAGVVGTFAMIVANIILLLVLKLSLRGFFIANILGQVVPAAYLFVRSHIWKYVRFNISNKELKHEMLGYCVPLVAVAVGWWVNSAADKYVVTFICGLAANGILSVSYKIPAIMNTLQTIFTQAWQISAVKEYGSEGTDFFYGRTFSVMNIFMSLACSVLVMLSKPIGHILYQREFYVAWEYVPFLLISSVVNASSGLLGPILSAKKESKPMAMSALYGAGANLILNVILVHLIGIQGATIATVISSFIIYLVRKRAVGDEIKIESYERVLITWLLLCVQAIVEIYTLYWWIELVILMVELILNSEEIFKITRSLKGVILH